MGHDVQQGSIEARIQQLEHDYTMLTRDFAKLNASVTENTDALNEFIALGRNLKFGMKFLAAMESTAVWITKVALAAGVLLGLWKFLIIETLRSSPPR